jgi:hypothetical protein
MDVAYETGTRPMRPSPQSGLLGSLRVGHHTAGAHTRSLISALHLFFATSLGLVAWSFSRLVVSLSPP